jgi:hypothetical protein
MARSLAQARPRTASAEIEIRDGFRWVGCSRVNWGNRVRLGCSTRGARISLSMKVGSISFRGRQVLHQIDGHETEYTPMLAEPRWATAQSGPSPQTADHRARQLFGRPAVAINLFREGNLQSSSTPRRFPLPKSESGATCRCK